MAKSTKPRKDWDIIRLDYSSGMSMKDLSEKYKIDYTQILAKARQKGWGEHNLIGKSLDAVIDVIRTDTKADEVLDASDELRELERQFVGTGTTRDEIKKQVYRKMIMQHQAFANNSQAYEIVKIYLEKLKNSISKSSDGLYTKSIGQGGAVTYGSYADDINKAIIPFISENNKVMGLTSAQVAIQNNFNPKNDDAINGQKVMINILPTKVIEHGD